MPSDCGMTAVAHHDLAIIDENGTVLAKRRIGDDLTGFNELLRLLAEHGDGAEDQIPIAIETGRGLFVACLIATGRDVVVINPMAAARYRERTVVARTSRAADALMLANFFGPIGMLTDRRPRTASWSLIACWPAPAKMPSGSVNRPLTSCDPYCGNTSRPHWSRFRSSTSAWPAPRPEQYWRLHPHRSRRPS